MICIFSNLTYIVWPNKPTLKWESYASSENQKIETTLQFMKNWNCFDSVSQEKNSLHEAVSHQHRDTQFSYKKMHKWLSLYLAAALRKFNQLKLFSLFPWWKS